jgi:hypothetical protein
MKAQWPPPTITRSARSSARVRARKRVCVCVRARALGLNVKPPTTAESPSHTRQLAASIQYATWQNTVLTADSANALLSVCTNIMWDTNHILRYVWYTDLHNILGLVFALTFSWVASLHWQILYFKIRATAVTKQKTFTYNYFILIDFIYIPTFPHLRGGGGGQ